MHQPEIAPPLPKPRGTAAWSRRCQEGLGARGLPAPATPGHEFPTPAHTPRTERARIPMVDNEFQHAAKSLCETGPAVTVFGPVRFRPHRPHGRPVREVGQAPTPARFATLTGGGPGIMEAACRGAPGAGGRRTGRNIGLPHAQAVSPCADARVELDGFIGRKTCLLNDPCGRIGVSGGPGPRDGLFEAAERCGKIGTFPVVLRGPEFWRGRPQGVRK